MIVCHLVGHSVPYVAHHHGGMVKLVNTQDLKSCG